MSGSTAERSSGTSAAALLSVWALVLLVEFLWHRGSDIGQLGSLMGNLGGGSLAGIGIFDTINGFCAATLNVAAWIGLGKLIRRYAVDIASSGRVFDLAINAAIGAAAWSLVWFLLGLIGEYTAFAAISATVVGIVAFLIPLRRYPAFASEVSGYTPLDYALCALVAVPVVLAFIAALAPPIAKDTLLYHYALPKAFIAQHSSAVVAGNIASYLPLGAEMHYVWAMLIGGIYSPRAAETAAGGISFWFFVLLLAVVYGWAKRLGIGRSWSLTATLVVAAIPTAYHVAASGYIDNALALYVTLAIFALSRWWTETDRGWQALLTICLAAALAIKLTSIFVFAGVALVVLLHARGSKASPADAKRYLIGGLGAMVLAGALACPWYISTLVRTGSPVFPFYLSVLKGSAPGWDVDRSNLFQSMNAAYGGESKSVVDYLLLPWNMSVLAQPEQTAYFDGVIGFAFLIGLPFLLWAVWKLDPAIDVKIAAGVAGVVFLFWLSSSQQLRYMVPVLPALAVAIIVSLVAVGRGDRTFAWAARLALAAASLVGIVTVFAWFCRSAPLRAALGGESRDGYLERNLDYYPYYEMINSDAPADAKVWLINMRRDTYNLDRAAVSDYLFEDWTLRQMLWQARSSEELKAKAASLGVEYILSRHDLLFDPRVSDLIDDKRSAAENDAKLKMTRDLLLDPSRTVRSDAKFSLVKLF